MKLLLYGVGYNSVSSFENDYLIMKKKVIKEQLSAIKKLIGVEETLILATNERTEYYLNVDENYFSHGDFLRYLSMYYKKEMPEIIADSYSLFNKEVVRHLLKFSSEKKNNVFNSLNSISQIESAVNFAVAADSIGKALKHLFKEVISFSINIRMDNKIQPLSSHPFFDIIEVFSSTWENYRWKKIIFENTTDEMMSLVKILIHKGFSNLYYINKNKESLIHVNDINCPVNIFNPNQSRPILTEVTEGSLNFHLATADAFVTNGSNLEEFCADYSCEEIRLIQQNRSSKLFVTIDTDLSVNILKLHSPCYVPDENWTTKPSHSTTINNEIDKYSEELFQQSSIDVWTNFEEFAYSSAQIRQIS